jgi:hypothetical protein
MKSQLLDVPWEYNFKDYKLTRFDYFLTWLDMPLIIQGRARFLLDFDKYYRPFGVRQETVQDWQYSMRICAIQKARKLNLDNSIYCVISDNSFETFKKLLIVLHKEFCKVKDKILVLQNNIKRYNENVLIAQYDLLDLQIRVASRLKKLELEKAKLLSKVS